MAKPLPDTLPDPIKERMVSLGYNMKTLSVKLGFNEGRMSSHFYSNLLYEQQYRSIARGFGLNMNEFYDLVCRGDFAKQLPEAIRANKCDSINSLARKLKVSPTLLHNLNRGEGEAKPLEKLYLVASALKMTIDEYLNARLSQH